MGLKTESREIDGFHVTTTQFGVFRQLDLLTTVGKMFSPVLSSVGGSLLAGQKMEDLLGIDVGTAAAMFFDKLSPGDVPRLATEALAGTFVVVNGGRVELTTRERIEVVFGPNIMTLLKVVWFALQVNFADFIAAARNSGRGEGEAKEA